MNYDDWLVHQEHKYRGWLDGEYECAECGKPMHEDKGYCCNICYEASMLWENDHPNVNIASPKILLS